MVQNLDPIPLILVNCIIVNKQIMNPCIVFQFLSVLVHFVAAIQNELFIQQIEVVYIHAAAIASGGFDSRPYNMIFSPPSYRRRGRSDIPQRNAQKASAVRQCCCNTVYCFQPNSS